MASTSREKRAADHVAPNSVTETVAVRVAAVATSTATANNESLVVFDQDVTISEINFIPDTAQAGADTDSRTIVVRNVEGDAAGTGDVASFAQTSGNDLSAYIPQELTLDGDEAAIAAGETLVYRSVEVGTGVASPAGTIVIAYTIDDDYS